MPIWQHAVVEWGSQDSFGRLQRVALAKYALFDPGPECRFDRPRAAPLQYTEGHGGFPANRLRQPRRCWHGFRPSTLRVSLLPVVPIRCRMNRSGRMGAAGQACAVESCDIKFQSCNAIRTAPWPVMPVSRRESHRDTLARCNHSQLGETP